MQRMACTLHRGFGCALGWLLCFEVLPQPLQCLFSFQSHLELLIPSFFPFNSLLTFSSSSSNHLHSPQLLIPSLQHTQKS